MQEKNYPFLESDVPGIFDDLVKEKLIDLPEMKRPDEAGKVNDPNYCKYHRLVGHPIEKCFVFKDKVMELASQGKILLEEDKVTTNQISIEFGTMDPVMINVPKEDDLQVVSPIKLDEGTDECFSSQEVKDEDLDGPWIVVCRRKRRVTRMSNFIPTRIKVVERSPRRDMRKAYHPGNKPKSMKTQESKTEILPRSVARPNQITLKDFMPKTFYQYDEFALCCHINGDGDESSDDKNLKETPILG